jgi:hypothetical protein
MAGPTPNEVIIYSQPKDGLISASAAGQTGTWTQQDWNNMIAETASLDAFEGFTAMFASRSHFRLKDISPPETWGRSRGYVSFYTSGFYDAGHVQEAKLRFYVNDGDGYLDDYDGSFQVQQSDWTFVVLGVSGGQLALQQTYELGFDPPTYGFGDKLGNDDWEGYFSHWGEASYPAGSSGMTLEHFIASGVYSELALQPGAIARKENSSGIYEFYGWIEIPIPLDALNYEGETHFRLVHMGEWLNEQPLTGPAGSWQHGQRLAIETDESLNEPELVITYITPATYVLGDLRLTDLSVNRFLQQAINEHITFSGMILLDGFPPDPGTGFTGTRNMSLEHVSSQTSIVELGSRRTQDSRRFLIDMVCDQRGELLDLEEYVRATLHGSTTVDDFRYGFVNPPAAGVLRFDNLRSFDMPPLSGPHRNRYHSVISVDAFFLRSG